ncbi:tail fiber protein [Methylobacterium persicinum]|uniref:Microcystin-dependent protein n=1 Tax=Methylobacterium persicinum TaxID=374426 RepID=A0ABU0HTH7_9HYPH|nr:tail fiber protein [Methylobacterium persicinum]MDQ0445227.1 microcystin-dependent protein [Methylobacterium persicinum]GJE37852.1 hypothetical protein KHHGKMAE_1914 [Methylobacterium persicinum]
MNRILAALLALVCLCLPASAATLLPPGQQTFTDANGKPLAGGSLSFYVPNTTTAKPTYKNAAQTVLNTNPVILDAAGRATVYGAGAYRQILKDRYGNLIWDQLTADTSSSQIAWGGTSTGTANAQVVSATNFTSADGQIVGFIAGFTNTGQLSVSANGSGAIPVLADTQSGSVNLSGQEVQAGAAVLLVYDANRGAFHLIGGNGSSGSGFGTIQNLPVANVVDLGLVNTHNVGITGNGTISSFGSSASTTSPIYQILIGGSVFLQGSSNLLVPGNTLYLGSGDALTALYSGGGQWRVINYQPASNSGLPAGLIASFASPQCPASWVAADGSAQSRTTFAALYAVIGGTWGVGDGSTTFNLPDLRGVFARGVDNGAGQDPGRILGSYQADALQDHNHPTYNATGGTSGTTAFNYPNANGSNVVGTGNVLNARAANETRPKNVAVLYCVKY